MVRKSFTIFSVVLSITFGIVLSLLTAEAVFYAVGYPLNDHVADGLPGSTTRDSVLGWKHKPGRFKYIDPVSPNSTFNVSYLSNSARVTGPKIGEVRPRILLLGCSFVEGYGLDDKETFAWQLQEILPDYEIVNLGVAGYGTYQAYLLEKEYFSLSPGDPPIAVIYGFADFHVFRNIKNGLIHRYWKEKGRFPYCEADKCRVWNGKPMGKLLQNSRLYSFLENTWDNLELQTQVKVAEQVTTNLLKQMESFTRRNNSRLILAPVHRAQNAWYDRFNKLGLKTYNCDLEHLEQVKGAELRLPDGHPNRRWSEIFAVCLAKMLQQDFVN